METGRMLTCLEHNVYVQRTQKKVTVKKDATKGCFYCDRRDVNTYRPREGNNSLTRACLGWNFLLDWIINKATLDLKAEIDICDPTFSNPNSYETVSTLLREIGCRTGRTIDSTILPLQTKHSHWLPTKIPSNWSCLWKYTMFGCKLQQTFEQWNQCKDILTEIERVLRNS